MYIGKLAEMTGATRKAIRLYESLGLIPVPSRNGNYRVYSDKRRGLDPDDQARPDGGIQPRRTEAPCRPEIYGQSISNRGGEPADRRETGEIVRGHERDHVARPAVDRASGRTESNFWLNSFPRQNS